MIACPACGAENDIQNKFCGQCGALLTPDLDHTGAITSVLGATSGSMTAVGEGANRSLLPGEAVLIVQRGPSQGAEFGLGGTDLVSLGRAPEAEVFLDDVTVSRRHAEIRRGAEGWSIRDVGSLNGTYVNRVRVDDQQLRGGEEIQIGKFRFMFLVGPESGS